MFNSLTPECALRDEPRKQHEIEEEIKSTLGAKQYDKIWTLLKELTERGWVIGFEEGYSAAVDR